MTLLADPLRALPTSASRESDDGCAASGRRVAVAALDPFLYQEMRWCEQRGELQPFVAMYESEDGRLEVCLGCGQPHFASFSRGTEAA